MKVDAIWNHTSLLGLRPSHRFRRAP